MSLKFLIGVDIGTQGTKTALFSEEGSMISASAEKSKLYRIPSGIVEEDPEQQFISVYRTIKECVKKSGINPGRVTGIAIDGQMAGIIGIGKDGRNVTPYDSWLDTRCTPYILKMEKIAGNEILDKTGCSPSFNHGPKILWWMYERKGIFKAIKSFVQPASYAAMRLCGLNASAAFVDKTYLHFTGFADNRYARWDEKLCARFHLDTKKLPRIVDPHAIIGEIIPSMAKKCGLKPWVPVVAGCGDTIASFLSCGATEEGICVDVAGTASVFAATTKEFCPDLKNRALACAHSASPDLWHSYAYINGGGENLEWFRQCITGFGPRNKKNALSLDMLNLMAEQVELDKNNPLFIPHLGGRVCPNQPNLRGAWVGLTNAHTAGHLYTAILESVALEYGIYKKIMFLLYKDFKPRHIRITGGGEKSAIWNRIKADALGMLVMKTNRPEGAPLGSAILAGFGTGLFKSLQAAAKRWIKTGNACKPDKKMKEYYRARLVRYETLLKLLNRLY